MRMGNITSGILFMVISSFGFALMMAFAKILSNSLPSMEIVFFRSFIMVIIILIIYSYNYYRHGITKANKKGGWGKLFIRVFMGGVAMVSIFYNISTIPLGTATAFAQSVPIYAVIFGILFLKEKVSIGVMLATIIGFVGILLISDPNFNDIALINIVVGILSGVTMAIAFVTLRTLKPYFDNAFLILAFGIGNAILGFCGMFLPFDGVGGFSLPNVWEWLLIVCMGTSGTVGQHFLNKAYINAPVGIVAPIDYSRVIFGIFLGIMLGDAFPNLITSIGIAFIVLSGLLIAMPALLDDLYRLRNRPNNKS